MTDAMETLGTIIPDGGGRDAIHVAVVPTVATERLAPGQHVGKDGTTNNPVGIVDPFLPGPVFKGERFWLLLYPRTITGLRHVWTHPAFGDDEPVSAMSEAEAWLRNYAEEIDEGFGTLMAAADDWVECGEYFYGAETDGYYGKFEGESTHPDFWKHYQAYRAKAVPEDRQQSFFTCSC